MDISVVLASYNGESYIDCQLNSIVNQLNSRDELIISDDNSDDRTLSIISKYLSTPNVHLVKNEGKGFLDNFTTAVKHAKNQIIVFSDQDDVWLDGRLNEIRNLFLKGADLVVLNSTFVDKNLKEISNNDKRVIKWKKGLVANFIKNTYTGAHMAVDRHFLEVVMPFPKSIKYHDLWIGLLAEYFKKEIIYSETSFTLYRRHDSNVTGERSPLLIIIKTRILLLYELIVKIICIRRRNLL